MTARCCHNVAGVTWRHYAIICGRTSTNLCVHDCILPVRHAGTKNFNGMLEYLGAVRGPMLPCLNGLVSNRFHFPGFCIMCPMGSIIRSNFVCPIDSVSNRTCESNAVVMCPIGSVSNWFGVQSYCVQLHRAQLGRSRSSACRKKIRCRRMALSAAILRYLSMPKFPWKLKYILEAFFLTTFLSTQKKCPNIYAVTLVLPLKEA